MTKEVSEYRVVRRARGATYEITVKNSGQAGPRQADRRRQGARGQSGSVRPAREYGSGAVRSLTCEV